MGSQTLKWSDITLIEMPTQKLQGRLYSLAEKLSHKRTGDNWADVAGGGRKRSFVKNAKNLYRPAINRRVTTELSQ